MRLFILLTNEHPEEKNKRRQRPDDHERGGGLPSSPTWHLLNEPYGSVFEKRKCTHNAGEKVTSGGIIRNEESPEKRLGDVTVNWILISIQQLTFEVYFMEGN